MFAEAGYHTIGLGKTWHGPPHPVWQTPRFFQNYDDVAGFFSLGKGYDEKEHRVVKQPGDPKIIMGGIYPYFDWGNTPASHLTDMAIESLKEEAKSDKPFLMCVGHMWPHSPHAGAPALGQALQT